MQSEAVDTDNKIMVSKEEMVEIVNGFLLSSPPGEYLDVVRDAHALLRNNAILNSSVLDTICEHNTEQMISVDSPNHNHKVLICKPGQINQREYFDYRGKQVIFFDHFNQRVTDSRPLSGMHLCNDLEPLRSELEEQVIAYGTEFFPLGVVGVYSSPLDRKVTVCISAAQFQPTTDAMIIGVWRSRYDCFLIAEKQIQINASIKLHFHSYEEGTVNADCNFTKSDCIEGTAVEILKFIHCVEHDFQQSLLNSYVHLNDYIFKAFRRAVLLKRNRIDWEKLARNIHLYKQSTYSPSRELLTQRLRKLFAKMRSDNDYKNYLMLLPAEIRNEVILFAISDPWFLYSPPSPPIAARRNKVK